MSMNMQAGRVYSVKPSGTPSIKRSAAGFTLIEVLMGVLVLGLGLLGLAAVFPAVVVQQRQAGDAVEGENAANAAEATLRGTEVFDGIVTNSGDGYYGLTSTLIRRADFSPQSEWVKSLAADDTLVLDPTTGGLTLALASTSPVVGEPALARELPVGLRVVPSIKRIEGTNDAAWREVNNRGDEPRFVWDVAFRRVKPVFTGTVSATDRLQAAMFVRRIDTGIRSAGDAQPLSRRLADTASRIVPVAVDANNVPQNNGVGRYSEVLIGSGDRVDGSPREMSIMGLSEADRRVVAQVGQKLVIGSRDTEPAVFEVRFVREDANAGNALTLELDKELPRSDLGDVDVEFLYTPQVPVAVRLITLTGKNP